MLHWISNCSLIRSTSCSCSIDCLGLGFQHQNLQEFTKISRALNKDIFLFPGAGGVGVGTQHQPRSVCSCEQALRAVRSAGGHRPFGLLALRGAARRGGGGGLSPRGCIAPLGGTSEVRRSSSPDRPPSGRAVRVRHPRAVCAGVRAWGPGTVSLLCMPCRELRAGGVLECCPQGGDLSPL